MTLNTPWTEDSYGPITHSGARKLADSGVAPLVALARGYETVQDAEGAKRLAGRATVDSGHLKLQRSITRLVDGREDILVMPWYALSEVTEDGVNASSYNTQYRPSRPPLNAEGKKQKYLWFQGEHLVLDLHPSTPGEWVDSSLDILTTEGILKGDSALTAQLIAAGISLETLSDVSHPESARVRLRDVMATIPKTLRVPIVNSASVTTWEDQADQWRHIKFRDRRVIIAFDGDLADNHMVWNQTRKAMAFVQSRKGQPFILSMFSPEVQTAQLTLGMDPAEKVGLDDYLTRIGDWASVRSLVTDQLPDEPERAVAKATAGDWRVSTENDALVQEFVQESTPDGRNRSYWATRYHVGGRVVSTIAKRRPNEDEIFTGLVDPNAALPFEDAMCEIEISLLDPEQDEDQTPTRHRVVGPASLLSINPRDWVRHAKQLPNEVLAHPNWPPAKGDQWLSALKAHRRTETERVIAWSTMGWVPVEGSMPAFILGNQVLGRTERDEQRTRLGVTDHELPGTSNFGVNDTYRDLDIDEYKAQVREDIRDVLAAYVENGFLTKRSVAVTTLAAALRPTLPRRPGITIYLVGPRRAGKSYIASFIIAPWQKRSGIEMLTGDAGDTTASIEHAVAHAPLWVVDDLAPQVLRAKAEQQEAAISQIIRNVHNNSARRRMDGKTMTQREVANPIAELIITAENPPQVQSIQERIINVNVPKGTFNDTDGGQAERALKNALNMNTGGSGSRLIAALIRLWNQEDSPLGRTWHERMKSLSIMAEDEENTAEEILQDEYDIPPGEARRHAKQVASLGLSLQVLYRLALWAGMDENDPVLAPFALDDERSYVRELAAMAGESVLRARRATPGRALVEALSEVLSTGRAHLRNATIAGAPPVSVKKGDAGGSEVARQNEALGWEFDGRSNTWVPKGVAIGYFGFTQDGEEVALFNASNAFKEAQRHFPNLIPFGQSSRVSWDSVRSENLSVGSPRKESSGSRVSLASTTDGSSARLSGVPVPMSVLSDASDVHD